MFCVACIRLESPVKGLCGYGQQLLDTHLVSGGGGGAVATGRWSECLGGI